MPFGGLAHFMSSDPNFPETSGGALPTRSIYACLGFYALSMIALVAVGYTNPDEWLNLEEYSPLQNLQAGVLAVAFGLNLYQVFKTQAEHRPFWIFVLFFTFFLFWREMDLDKEFLHARMFSWNYLFKSEHLIPLWSKIVLGTISISIAVSWVGYCAWQHKAVWKGFWRRQHPVALFWGLMTFAALFAAQVWDKATMLQRHVYIGISDLRVDKDPYIEEALELMGEIGALVLIITLVRLKPQPLKELWAPCLAWVRSDRGRTVGRIAGVLLVVSGLAALGLVLHRTFTHQPHPYEFEYYADFTTLEGNTRLDYMGLKRGQIVLFALCGALACGWTGLGVLLVRMRGSWKVGAGVAVAAVVMIALPPLLLKPSPVHNVRLHILLGHELEAGAKERLHARLEPAAALSTLPESVFEKFKQLREEGLQHFKMPADADETDDRVSFAFAFKHQLGTRARNTLSEFYFQYATAEVLKEAEAEGLAVPIFKKPDYHPLTAAESIHFHGSIWARFRKEWGLWIAYKDSHAAKEKPR